MTSERSHSGRRTTTAIVPQNSMPLSKLTNPVSGILVPEPHVPPLKRRLCMVDSGFDAGVAFITPMMTPHGISAASSNGFNEAVARGDAGVNVPKRLSDDSIWIMFESCAQISITKWAQNDATFRDVQYRKFWSGLQRLDAGGKLPHGTILGGPPGFH